MEQKQLGEQHRPARCRPAWRVSAAAGAGLVVLLLGACRSTPVSAPVEERSPGRPPTSVPARPAAPPAAPVIEDRSIRPAGPANVPAAAPAVPGPSAAVATDGRYTVQRGDTLYSIAMATGRDARDLARWNGLEDPNRIVPGQVLRTDGPSAEVASGSQPASAGATAGAGAGGAPAGAAAAASAAVPAPGRVESRSLDTAPAAAAPGAPASATTAPVSPRAGAGAAPAVGATPGASASAVPPSAAGPAAAGSAESTFAWPSRGRVIERFDETKNKGIDIAGNEGDPVLAAADGQVVYVGNGLRGYGNLLIVKHSEEFITAYAHNRAVLVKQGDAIKRGQRVAELGRTDAEQPKLHFEIRRQGKPVDPLLFLPAR